MKPEDYRQLINRIGTPIGLIGEYSGSSDWSHGEVIKGTLTSYLVVQRKDDKENSVWDTAAIVSLNNPLNSTGIDTKEFSGNRLLLLHRYLDLAWDNKDPNVHVYGLHENAIVSNDPLPYNQWRPQSIWLSSAAIMTVEDPIAPSEMALAFQRKANRRSKDEESEST